MHKLLSSSLLLLLLTGLVSSATGQHPFRSAKGSNDILHALDRAGKVGKVLYLAAHPDDENTQVIAHLSRNEHIRTAYLSLTRGGGGQNLIGPEQGELLSVLRTHELLQARKIDGGKQFFSRAKDFGYSKTAKETFDMWGKKDVLRDVVRVIRSYRPNVIITRFPEEGYEGAHGHHTASAILAREAFNKAGDPEVFPEQLEELETHKPKRLLYNTSTWWDEELPEKVGDDPELFRVDVGEYDPYTGLSFTEIAARARSMHKCQGFGVEAKRGRTWEYFRILEDRVELDGPPSRIMEGISTDPEELDGGKAYAKQIRKARKDFEAARPEAIVPQLIEAYKGLEQLESDHWRELLRRETRRLILACGGTYIEATTEEPSASKGDSFRVRLELTHRSEVPLKTRKAKIGREDSNWAVQAKEDRVNELEMKGKVPEKGEISTPHWLELPSSEGTYRAADGEGSSLVRALPQKDHLVDLGLSVKGQGLDVRIPIEHKEQSRVEGGVYESFRTLPLVTVSSHHDALIFPDDETKEMEVTYRAHKAGITAEASLDLPDGWKAEEGTKGLKFEKKGEQQKVSFRIEATPDAENGPARAYAMVSGTRYDKREDRIEYDHIPDQMVIREGGSRLVHLGTGRRNARIGYIMGSGDPIPEALKQLGYRVELIPAHELEGEDLSRYDAIVTGIRAFNVNESLRYHNEQLFEYVKNGGHLVSQYNKDEDALITDEIAPYPLHPSHDRVTVETAEPEILDPEHRIFNTPNKIDSEDFDGWVQERGLYFPDEWDEKYTPLIAWNDPGEGTKKGGLLVAEHGDGTFIYTGISFFRQLPAGVPGAYRLFDNLISYGIEREGP